VALALPHGPRGQALALAMAMVALALAWFGIAGPVLDWQADRAETLRRQQALAHRMAMLVETLPSLREAASHATDSGRRPGALLAGTTDALAAARLQQTLDELAAASGVRIGSEEILPVQAEGEFRAIAVRVTLTAPWRSVVALLQAMAKAEVPMMADEMQLRAPPGNTHDPNLPVAASFTVTAYRAAAS
jgi:hypothetical protein